MIVIRKRPNIHTFFLPGGVSLQLLPGVNAFNKDQSALLKKECRKILLAQQSQGHIEIKDDDGLAEDAVSAVLECKNIPEAKKLIENIFDLGQLDKLAEVEKRRALTTAVAAQIKLVEKKLSKPGELQNPNGGSPNSESLGDL